MNILFLTLVGDNNLDNRGIYNDLMRQFIKEGHEVYMVVPFERRKGRDTELFESGGAKILAVKTLNIQKTNIIEKGIGTLLLENQYMTAIKKYFKDIRFDLVLYSTPPITFNKVINWVKKRYNAKSYLLLKDIFPQNAVDLGMFSKNSLFYRFFRRKERRLYELSDYIGCMSPANVAYILKHNSFIKREKVEVCPNSIELVELQPVDKLKIKSKYDIPDNKVLCIYGGNIGKPQGVDFLIETIESNEKRDNCYFLIVGGGTEYSRLQRWFNERKPNNAKLLSALSKTDYDILMRSADIGLIYLDKCFTIPNYPSRLLSYMENGIPIMMAVDINTDIGRIAEANGYGYWVQSGKLNEFDHKLDKLICDDALRKIMGENGLQYLKENYTVDNVCKIIMNHL